METDKVKLYNNFLLENSAKELFAVLSNSDNITWHEKLQNSRTGELQKINRKMAYVSDIDGFEYKYADLSFPGQLWIPELARVCEVLNKFTSHTFNSVLLNWYKNGKDTINYHADKEEILKGGIEESVIACVNLGATRKFWFRKISADEPDFYYEVSNGDLLMMNAGCQSEYLHAIRKESEVTEPRISLTFRETI